MFRFQSGKNQTTKRRRTAGDFRDRLALWNLAFALLATTPVASARDEFTPLKSDERITLYPAVARQVPNSKLWRAELTGCVFEPEPRTVSVAALRQALGLSGVELSPDEERLFNARARLFLVDHERGKRVFVRLNADQFSLGKTRRDGRFAGAVEFPVATVERGSSNRREAGADENRGQAEAGFTVTAILAPGDSRVFMGRLFPLANEGVSVISDIDDTIKITEVRDRSATLRNTFLREFRPVPGMAELYQSLARSNGAAFHYISASPWQLYEPLNDFVQANGFPAGTFTLKEFRWKDRSFFNLFADPEKYKLGVIEPLLRQFPQRRFILVGDSGERDPEIYGELARRYPGQIERIAIRDVTGDALAGERYAKAFRAVKPERWQIFRAPAELSEKPLMSSDGRR